MRLTAWLVKRLKRLLQSRCTSFFLFLLIPSVMPPTVAVTRGLRKLPQTAHLRLPASVESEQAVPNPSTSLEVSGNQHERSLAEILTGQRNLFTFRGSGDVRRSDDDPDESSPEGSIIESQSSSRGSPRTNRIESGDGGANSEEADNRHSRKVQEDLSDDEPSSTDEHISLNDGAICGSPITSNFPGSKNTLDDDRKFTGTTSSGFQDRIVGGGPATLNQNGFMVLFTLKMPFETSASRRQFVDDGDEFLDDGHDWDSDGEKPPPAEDEESSVVFTSPRATGEGEDEQLRDDDEAEESQPSAEGADGASTTAAGDSRPAVGFSSSSAETLPSSSAHSASVWCGGVLISRRLVLTAAHCFANGNLPSDMDIHIGIDHQASAAAGDLRGPIKSPEYSDMPRKSKGSHDPEEYGSDLNAYGDYDEAIKAEDADYDEKTDASMLESETRSSPESSVMGERKYLFGTESGDLKNATLHRTYSRKISKEEQGPADGQKPAKRGKQTQNHQIARTVQRSTSNDGEASWRMSKNEPKPINVDYDDHSASGAAAAAREPTKANSRKRRYITYTSKDDDRNLLEGTEDSSSDYADDDEADGKYTAPAIRPEATSASVPSSSSAAEAPVESVGPNSKYLFSAQDWVFHTEFHPETFHADLAIVLLDRPAPFSEQTWPVCFPPPDIAGILQSPGQRTTAVGWGLTREDTPGDSSKLGALKKSVLHDADGLQSVGLSVLSSRECETLFHDAGVASVKVHDSQLCAYTDKKDVDRGPCQGDSGGPLVTTIGRKAVLLGIISAGTGCEVADGEQALPVPALYVKVSEFLPWIFDNSDELLVRNDLKY